jgi:cell division protein FtsQ
MSSVYELREGADGSPGGSLARWVRPLLISLIALCAFFLLCRFVAVPITQIRHVTVQSDIRLTDAQILALSGIQGDEHWLTLNTAAIERKLEANPLIRHAVVQRVFPDTVRMTVWGRQPVALVLAEADGRSLPVLVDGDGIVFKVGATSAELDVPVISGLTVGETALGARLPSDYASLFADLKSLREKAPALYALLSEVRLTAPDVAASEAGPRGDLEALLYLTSSPVPVRIRGTIDESLMKYTLMVLDLLSKQGVLKDIQELDFRSGDVVYRIGAPAAGAASVPGAGAANAPSTGAANAGARGK